MKVNLKFFILVLIFFIFASCARKYEILDNNNIQNKKLGEVIYSNDTDRVLCYSTIIFYGGYCWLIGYGESNLNDINDVKQYVYDEKKLENVIIKRSENKIFMDFKNKISLVDYKLSSKGKNNDNLNYIEANAVVLPIATLGEISVTQKTIIFNELFDVVTQNYNVISQEEYEKAENKAFEELEFDQCTEDQCIKLIQEILQVENMFHLQLVRENNNTQISLSFIDLDRKINSIIFHLKYLCDTLNGIPMNEVARYVRDGIEKKGENGFRKELIDLGKPKTEIDIWFKFTRFSLKNKNEIKHRTLDICLLTTYMG